MSKIDFTNFDSIIVGNNLQEILEEELKHLVEACTECGNCVKQCTYLQRFGNPLQLARQFQAGSLDVETVYSCSLCKLCDVFCPESLRPSYAFWLMRCSMVEQGRAPLARHRKILAYEKYGFSKLFSHWAIPAGCTTVFFPGCALTGTRPQQTLALFRLLREEIPQLGMILGCCAKPSHDLGRLAFFKDAFFSLINRLEAHSITRVLTACPSCHQMISQYAPGLQSTMVYEILEDVIAATDAGQGTALAVHDPCATRFDGGIHRSVRSIVARLGFSPTEMKHRGKRTLCCGEGGSACYIAADITDCWSDKRKVEAASTRVLTYCAGCVSFLGRKLATAHIIDLLLDPVRTLAGKEKISRSPVTWLNRLRLKQKLKSICKS
jgi:Fe-S oxidoreductase